MAVHIIDMWKIEQRSLSDKSENLGKLFEGFISNPLYKHYFLGSTYETNISSSTFGVILKPLSENEPELTHRVPRAHLFEGTERAPSDGQVVVWHGTGSCVSGTQIE